MNIALNAIRYKDIRSLDQIEAKTQIWFGADCFITVDHAVKDGDLLNVSGFYSKGTKHGYISGTLADVSGLMEA